MTENRWQSVGQSFGVTDGDWPDKADGNGVRHLHLSMRKPRSQNDRSATWLYAATVLLGLLAVGLLVVSLAAQYRYVMSERHQAIPAAIEAVGLDVAMTVFSLLAIALAWRGLSARTERVLVVACALGSAGMNYAAANGGSPRSVAAYIMPPLLLAIVVDRVVAVVRKHVLGDKEPSAWSGFGRVALYGLRFLLAAPSTATGLRRQVLVMTPLPEAPAKVKSIGAGTSPNGTRLVVPRSDSKTSKFRELVVDHYGPVETIDPKQVSPISTALAPLADLDVGAARSALGKWVKTSQNGHGDG